MTKRDTSGSRGSCGRRLRRRHLDIGSVGNHPHRPMAASEQRSKEIVSTLRGFLAAEKPEETSAIKDNENLFDADLLRAHLELHGVTPGEVRQRYGAEGDGDSMYITDPDGNKVELKGPSPPA